MEEGRPHFFVLPIMENHSQRVFQLKLTQILSTVQTPKAPCGANSLRILLDANQLHDVLSQRSVSSLCRYSFSDPATPHLVPWMLHGGPRLCLFWAQVRGTNSLELSCILELGVYNEFSGNIWYSTLIWLEKLKKPWRWHLPASWHFAYNNSSSHGILCRLRLGVTNPYYVSSEGGMPCLALGQ